MYSLTNIGTAERIVYDRRRRLISVTPGATRDNVDMDDGAAEYIARHSKSLKIERMEAPTASASASVRPVDERGEPAVRTPAQLLVSAKDDMAYPQLRREAARTLGDAWPGGKPSREEIMKLLNAKKMGF